MQERCNSSANALELHLSCTNHNGLMQGKCNSNALAMELSLSCTDPLIFCLFSTAKHMLKPFDFLCALTNIPVDWLIGAINKNVNSDEQSGTKPNLVAKIWPPNLVTICAWLPKLVDSISFYFHHLINTGVGSLARWLPLMVANTCKLEAIWVVYIWGIGNGSIWL